MYSLTSSESDSYCLGKSYSTYSPFTPLLPGDRYSISNTAVFPPASFRRINTFASISRGHGHAPTSSIEKSSIFKSKTSLRSVTSGFILRSISYIPFSALRPNLKKVSTVKTEQTPKTMIKSIFFLKDKKNLFFVSFIV